jgi:hypothetical protein
MQELRSMLELDEPPVTEPPRRGKIWALTIVEQMDGHLYKRGPYLPHKRFINRLEYIFEALSPPSSIPYGGLTHLARLSGIPRTTLDTWRTKMQIDPHWRPSADHYAEAHQAFTPDQELRLTQEIQARFLQQGLYYSDQDFRHDALRFHQRLVAEAHEAVATGRVPDLPKRFDFECSPCFIQAFRHRHRFALRRPSYHRRCRVTKEQMAQFVDQGRRQMAQYPLDRVINIDETHWKIVAGGFLTWGIRGAEAVPCTLENDAKEGVTVIAGITAGGEKLPLTVVGKGKTPRCLQGYQLPPQVWSDHSPSGWTTTDVMCRYLAHLRDALFKDGPLLVILDTYAAHRAQAVRDAARLCNIDLLFIPPGCTDRLQPLDRRVFGVMKAYARRDWRIAYHETGGGKVTRAQMAEHLVAAWNRLRPEVIASAWSIYVNIPEWGEDEESEPEDPHDAAYRERFLLDDIQDL